MSSKEGIYFIYSRFPDGRYIYKVGMSRNLDKRLKQYPQNYEEVLSFPCKNSLDVEKHVLQTVCSLNEEGVLKCKYGNEYFQSDSDCVEKIKSKISDLFVSQKKCVSLQPRDRWVEMVRQEIPVAFGAMVKKFIFEVEQRKLVCDTIVNMIENRTGFDNQETEMESKKEKNINQAEQEKTRCEQEKTRCEQETPCKSAAKRILSNFLHLSYNYFNGDKKDIYDRLKGFDDVVILPHKNKIIAILYNNVRFDIKTKRYIMKNFQVGSDIPIVKSIKKEEANTELENSFKDDSYKNVMAKGIFDTKLSLLKNEKEKEIYLVQDELEKELKKMKGKSTTVKTPTNTIKNLHINNITNISVMRVYKDVDTMSIGNEDISRMSYENDYLTILNHADNNEPRIENMIGRAIRVLHFNKDFPENNNIFVTTKASVPVCTVFVNGEWRIDLPLQNVFPLLIKSISRLCLKFQTHGNDDEQRATKRLNDALMDATCVPDKYGINVVLYSCTKIDVPKIVEYMNTQKILN